MRGQDDGRRRRLRPPAARGDKRSQAQGKARRQARPKRRSLFGRLLSAVPGLLVLGLVAWVALFAFIAPPLPDTKAIEAERGGARVTLIAADGSILAVRGAEGRAYVPIEDMAQALRDAVIAIEDHRFFGHFGLDPIGLARAMLANLMAGGIVEGGSTITQQLAKNLYLTPERSIRRKLEELTLAIWLEATLSKDEILELYLNRVYLGAGAYGVEAASQRYFAKPAAALDLPEAAMIAGLLKAPSAFAPTNALERARARAATVLRRMAELGFVSEAEARAAIEAPARLADGDGQQLAGHFLDWVQDGLTEQLGKPETDLIVKTTLDPHLQRVAETSLRRWLEREGAARGAGDGAIVLLDAGGAVRAMVGGRNYRTSRFNRAANAHRQPGSAFKPFLYAAALEAGLTPDTLLEDRPITIGGWSPANHDGSFGGTVSLADAFAQSLNPAAVRLLMDLGPRRVIDLAHEAGIASDLQPVPSLALGTSEVTPLELAAAYQTLAAGGLRRPLHAVNEIIDAAGEAYYRRQPVEVRVLNAGTAAALEEIMAHAVEDGTGRAARLDGRPAAGKTGTSQNYRDAWFAGFSQGWTAVVWIGNDDNRPMDRVTGAVLPARIWRDVMRATPAPPPVIARPRDDRPEDAPDYAGVYVKRGIDWLIGLVEGALETARQ